MLRHGEDYAAARGQEALLQHPPVVFDVLEHIEAADYVELVAERDVGASICSSPLRRSLRAAYSRPSMCASLPSTAARGTRTRARRARSRCRTHLEEAAQLRECRRSAQTMRRLRARNQ